MKKFEDLDLNQVDWSKYEKQLNRIDSRLSKIKKNEKMMKRVESPYNNELTKIKIDGDLSYKLAFRDKYEDITISSNKVYTKEQMAKICKAHYENDLYLVSGKDLDRLEKEIEDLIKYLESKIKECDYQVDIIGNYQKICERRAYQDILERLKSGKYE